MYRLVGGMDRRQKKNEESSNEVEGKKVLKLLFIKHSEKKKK
jgi:hypothetical protein